MSSVLKRSSMSGLNTCTRCRAMTARRRRLISSSDFPENMPPAMISIQPPLITVQGIASGIGVTRRITNEVASGQWPVVSVIPARLPVTTDHCRPSRILLLSKPHPVKSVLLAAPRVRSRRRAQRANGAAPPYRHHHHPSARCLLERPRPGTDALYKLADRLHIETRKSVIEKFLLFREGDPYSP